MQPSFSETLSCDYFLAKALACIKESNIILKKGVDCTEKDAKKLITYKDNFFTYFDFAVLGGEFYADHKSTLDSIRLQSIDFGKIERLSDTESYPILEKIYQTANYGEILSNSISVYTNLLEYKSIIHPDFLSLDDRIFFFSHKSNTLKSIDDFVHYHTKLNSIDKEDLTWFSLFNINVLLAIQEATLKCEPKNIRNLREIELLLEKEEYKSYSSLRILKEKAQYLSFKTEIRLLKGSISSIDISRIKQNKYYYFKDFYDQTVKFWINKDQTFGESNITEIRSKQHLVLSNDPKPLLSVYHFLNKYFKVKNQRERSIEFAKGNLQELKALKGRLQNTWVKESKKDFSGYSECTILNLLNSSILSLSYFVKFEEFKMLKPITDKDVLKFIEEIKLEYKKYYAFQEEQSIYNYCLSKNVLDVLGKLLEQINNIDSKDLSAITMKSVEEIIDVIDFIELDKAYQWEKQNYHLPVYLSFKDCIRVMPLENSDETYSSIDVFKNVASTPITPERSTVNNDEVKIYLDSSYIIPVNYENVETELQLYKRRIEKNKTLLIEKVLNNLSNNAEIKFGEQKIELEKDFRKKSDALENASRDSIKQYISTLGIFASIITYVLGGIKLATDISTTLHEKAVLLFLLGIGLMSFLVAIEYVVIKRQREENEKKQYSHYKFLGLIIVIDVLIFCMLKYGYFEPSYNKVTKTIKNSNVVVSGKDTVRVVRDSTKIDIQN